MFLGALTVRATVLVTIGDHPLLQPRGVLDSAVYVQLARQVASGDVLVGNEAFFVSPLYIYFVGAVFAFGGGLMTIRFLQLVLGSIAVVLVAETSEQWFGRRAGLIAGTLLILTGVVAFYEVTLLQSALDPFLVALALFVLARALVRRTARWHAAAGCAAALFALNRPNALLWIVALVGVIAWRYGLRLAGAFALGSLVTFMPVTLRNWIVSREPILVSSHGGLNFYIGNNPRADGTYRHVPGITPDIRGQRAGARRLAARHAGRPVTARETSRFFYSRAWEWIRSEPGRAIALFNRKVAYTFNRADLALNHSFAFFRTEVRSPLRLLVVGPWLVFPLGLAGFLVRPRVDRRDYLIWASFVPIYAASVALFFVSSRYRLPLLVPACAMAAGTIITIFERRHAVRIALGAATLAVFVNWNFGLDEGRAHEGSSLVFYLIEQKRFDEAERILRRIESIHSDPATLYWRVGLAYRDSGSVDQAIAMFRRALAAPASAREVHLAAAVSLASSLRSSGHHSEALATVRRLDPALLDARHAAEAGRIALDAGDAQVARPLLERAVSLDDSAAFRHDLGIAYALSGRSADAVLQFEEARERDPNNPATLLNLAVLYADAGRTSDARELAREALRLRPGYERAAGLLKQLGARE